ncbi:TlpA disulfide reductase family protein [Coprobacter tertius]|uniref:AhpC/TSA family protein n=1 Tax=Coprobacter tertius TaxID=2944915 RepID=A0ABT1MHM7_9BACT|nr:TlpA disulfide reductase family protein [Coprobacter tertius]MCP9612132.1 AhpC/TSA family protein [Coprobacter tertius]
MYNKIVMFFTTVFTLYSCTESYVIQGTVDKAANGDWAYLQKQAGNTFVGVDSVQIKNGSFIFKGRQDSATMAVISVIGKEARSYSPLLFVLENGELEAEIDTLSVISGSILNDIFQRYMTKRLQIENTLQVLSRDYLTSYISGVLNDSLVTVMKKAFSDTENQLKILTKKYIISNTGNISGVFVFIQNSFLFDPQEQREIISTSEPYFRKNHEIKSFEALLERTKNVEPGMPYIDIVMQNPSGHQVTLSDYIGNGKYVLIDFWASWCGPCRKQMPELKAIYNRFKSDKFELIGVSFDNNRQEWLRYIHDNHLTWPQMSDLKGWDSEVIMLYAIQGIPHTVLIDPSGKIVANNLKGNELVQKLVELLEK